jgi:hypothetical protein
MRVETARYVGANEDDSNDIRMTRAEVRDDYCSRIKNSFLASRRGREQGIGLSSENSRIAVASVLKG